MAIFYEKRVQHELNVENEKRERKIESSDE